MHCWNHCSNWIQVPLKWPELARWHSLVKSRPFKRQKAVCVCAQLSALCRCANISYYCRWVLTSPYALLQLCMLATTCVFAVSTDGSTIGPPVTRCAQRRTGKKGFWLAYELKLHKLKQSWTLQKSEILARGDFGVLLWGVWPVNIPLVPLDAQNGLPNMTHPEVLLWIHAHSVL